jgi:hypothetical protein
MDAKCTDGTAMGACSATKPLYCTASLALANDADACGCPTGRVVSYNGSTCVDPKMSSKREDSFFDIVTDVRMLVRNSAMKECEKGDYIYVEVQVDNKGYFTPFTVSPSELSLYVDNEDYPRDSGWMELSFPENDSICSEPARFRTSTIPPGSYSAGVVWYKLKRWDTSADYSLFYQDKFRVHLNPDTEQ